MPLDFRGMALVDLPKRRVRFAGYIGRSRAAKMVVCAVSVEALKALAGAEELSENELMEVFALHKVSIFTAASAQFDAGNFRPHVQAKDLAGAIV